QKKKKKNITRTLLIVGLCMLVFPVANVWSQSNMININIGDNGDYISNLGAVESNIWNSFYKGSSGLLLDNNKQLTTCYLKTNVIGTTESNIEINHANQKLLKNSAKAKEHVILNFYNIPYSNYDVVVYVSEIKRVKEDYEITVGNITRKIDVGSKRGDTGNHYLIFEDNQELTLSVKTNSITGPSAIQIVETSDEDKNTKIANANDEIFSVYPTIASDFIRVKSNYTDNSNDYSVTLYAANGTIAFKGMLSNGSSALTISTSEFAKGNYIVGIKRGGELVHSESIIVK
ncbi:MAG: hypothetical protein MI922_07810, partial [Bacteroidales bacterium]|nr:hypothetical protein [Bacteroidales bacterium]